MSAPLSLCGCGNLPFMKEDTNQCGHGCYVRVNWLQCQCGMQTKHFNEWTDGSEEERKLKATIAWNKAMSREV